MAKRLSPFCSLIGQRKIAMSRTWKRIKELDREGKPTVDIFGKIFKDEYLKAKKEGRRRVSEGKCFIEE